MEFDWKSVIFWFCGLVFFLDLVDCVFFFFVGGYDFFGGQLVYGVVEVLVVCVFGFVQFFVFEVVIQWCYVVVGVVLFFDGVCVGVVLVDCVGCFVVYGQVQCGECIGLGWGLFFGFVGVGEGCGC